MKPMKPAERARVDVDRPIFVCGVGRSGTSLLQAMLAAHPDLSVPPETRFLRNYLLDRRREARLEAEGPEALLERLRGDERFARVGLDPEALLLPFLERRRPFRVLSAYRSMLAVLAERRGASRVADKDPRLVADLERLHALFPAARVVHLVRDPRDVVLSRTQAAWSADRPWWSHALVWRCQVERGRRAGRARFGEAYLELRYEDLLEDPRESLERVASHVGLAPSERMLHEFGQRAAELVHPSERAWKGATLGPLKTQNSGRWRAGLSPARAAFIEGLCLSSMERFGYAPEAASGALTGRLLPRALGFAAERLYGPAERTASLFRGAA